jgi:hypothetical protein
MAGTEVSVCRRHRAGSASRSAVTAHDVAVDSLDLPCLAGKQDGALGIWEALRSRSLSRPASVAVTGAEGRDHHGLRREAFGRISRSRLPWGVAQLWPRRPYGHSTAASHRAGSNGPKPVAASGIRRRVSSGVVSAGTARQAGGRWFEPSSAHHRDPVQPCGIQRAAPG